MTNYLDNWNLENKFHSGVNQNTDISIEEYQLQNNVVSAKWWPFCLGLNELS